MESGEQPWWLDNSPSKVPEGVQRMESEGSNSNSDESSGSYERVEIGLARGLARFPVEDEPLGARASPEGVRCCFVLCSWGR